MARSKYSARREIEKTAPISNLPVLTMSSLGRLGQVSPDTARTRELNLPTEMGDLSFYADFFILSNCDIVCVSNSTFSFAACMLNANGRAFIRSHWDLSTKFTRFDPWSSQPVLWFGGKNAKFLKRSWSVLRLTYLTQGVGAALKTLLYYLPKSHLRVIGLRIYLGYQIEGAIGVGKSLLCTLGWRSIWAKQS
jgi:hypothetical protein